MPDQDEIPRSEERYRSIYESSPVGIIIVDRAGTILRCNKALERFWGYTEEEAQKMTFAQLFYDDDLSVGLNFLKSLTEGRTDSCVFEKRYVHKDGHIVWGRVSISAIREKDDAFLHTIAIVEDITDRKHDEDGLRRSEQQLRMVWEKSADSMRLTSNTGVLLMVNEAFCRMVEMKREDLEGKTLDVIYAPEVRPHVKQLHDERFMYRTVAPRFERELMLWNGKKCWFELTNSFIDFNDESVLLGIFRDVTDRKRIERELEINREQLLKKTKELESSIQDLKQMQDSLVQSEKMASIGQLTAGIAHEINNPLAFVASNLNRFAEYFEEMKNSEQAWRRFSDTPGPQRSTTDPERADVPPGSPEELEFIIADFSRLMDHTRSGVERIRKIVEQLRGFSHVSDQQFAEEDINKALDDTLVITWNELKYTAEIVKEYGDLPLVMCNIGELKQVFVNLLVNAAHAIGEKGTITLRTSAAEGDHITIEITDTGCGIPPENLKRIFDPFFTTKPVGKGTGLGLWISATLIQRHTGSITVRSELHKGTTFIIKVPRHPDGAER